MFAVSDVKKSALPNSSTNSATTTNNNNGSIHQQLHQQFQKQHQHPPSLPPPQPKGMVNSSQPAEGGAPHVVTVSGTYQPPTSVFYRPPPTSTVISSPLVMLATSAAQSPTGSPAKRRMEGIAEEPADEGGKRMKAEGQQEL